MFSKKLNEAFWAEGRQFVVYLHTQALTFERSKTTLWALCFPWLFNMERSDFSYCHFDSPVVLTFEKWVRLLVRIPFCECGSRSRLAVRSPENCGRVRSVFASILHLGLKGFCANVLYIQSFFHLL
jgi:hypothetical protein